MPALQHGPSPQGDGQQQCDSAALAALLDVGEPGDWRDNALCAQTDPDAFFPDKGGSTREAKRLCNGTRDREPCPVREQCLDDALAHDDRWGVWGGLSERERRRLRPTQERRLPEIDHGRESGAKAHRRRGEKPCRECSNAELVARRERGAA